MLLTLTKAPVVFAEAPQSFRRIRYDLGGGGPLRLAAGYLRRRWREATDRRVVTFEWRPGSGSASETGAPGFGDALWLGRYPNPADVPVAFYRAAEAEEGPGVSGRLLDGFLSSAVLWVPWLGGRPAGYLQIRRDEAPVGSAVAGPGAAATGEAASAGGSWPEARLLSLTTFRPYRGRRVARRAAAEACRREVAPGGRAIAFARESDAAAVRALEAAGFRPVADGPDRRASSPGPR